jgi:hypothetical protein
MPDYTITSGDVVGAALKTLVTVLTPATRRAKLKKVIIGSSGTPADNAAKFQVRRITTDGTGTAATPGPVEVADPAALCTAKVNYTVEPTYVAGSLLEIDLNQRATIQWFSMDELEKVVAAISSGLGLQMVAGPAVAYNATLGYTE